MVVKKYRWEINYWKYLIPDRGNWLVPIQTTTKFRVPQNVETLFPTWVSTSFSRRTIIRVVKGLIGCFVRCFVGLKFIFMLTQLSIPTHAQLQRHRLKFIKNHLKTPTSFGLRPSSGSYNVLAKITIILTTVGCFYAKSGDVAACRVVCIGLYLKSAWVYVF